MAGRNVMAEQPKMSSNVEAEFLSAIIQGKMSVSHRFLDSIDPDSFSVDSYKWMFNKMKDRKWRKLHIDLLEEELNRVEDQETRDLYRRQVSILYDRSVEYPNEALEKFKSQVAYKILYSSMYSSIEGYNRSGRTDLLVSEVRKGVREASDILEEDGVKVVDYADHYYERQRKRMLIRDNPNLSPRILTGINGLDNQFLIRAPMLVDFLAPFKRYKSIILNAMGYAALLQGFNVLHVIYENTVELTEDRYDSMFSEINFERVSNSLVTQEEKEFMDRMFGWMGSWGNRLKIIKCESQSTTVADVEDKVNRIRDDEGFSPDVEIWDYLNLIAPSKSFKGDGQERREQKQIIWDLKTHAEKFNVAVIEASQANMEGATADRLKFNHRGKSIDISQGLDLCIAIDQSEKEREEGIIVLSPMFFRQGQIKIPEIILDSDISRMIIAKEIFKLWENAKNINPYS